MTAAVITGFVAVFAQDAPLPLIVPGDVCAERRVLGITQSIPQTGHEGCAAHEMPVQWVCGCRVHFDQEFIVLGRRFFHFFDLKNIG